MIDTDESNGSSVLTAKQQRPAHLFQPGQSGNPAGRPKGSRSKLSEAFLKTLADDFTEHGVGVIEDLRKKQPAQYCNVIAKLMPKLMELSGPDGEALPATMLNYVPRSKDE